MTKKYSIVLGLAVLTFILISTPVQAQNQPIQIALFTPIQIFPEDNTIEGLRLNLVYGRNASVNGLDIGMFNHITKGVSKGVQFGVLGLVDADFTGLQFNIVNVTRGKFEGLQLGFVNFAGSIKGLQIGFVNIINQGGAFPVFPIVNWSF